MRIRFNNAGQCTVANEDGRVLSRFATEWEPAFNRQYATPLSPDGSLLLIGTWSRGLFCYRTIDGTLLWRAGPGRVRQLAVANGTVVAEMAGRGVYQRQLKDGIIVRTIPMSGITSFFQLGPFELFVGPRRGRYFLLELPQLTVRSTIPHHILNPKRCLSFMILSCRRVGAGLEISGWEEHPFPLRRFRRLVSGAT